MSSSEAVTVSWADQERGWYGLARLGAGPDGGSALAVLFQGREAVGGLALGALEVAGDDWADRTIGALRTTTSTIEWSGSDSGFALELEAISPPIGTSVAGVEGTEQLVRVRGTVRSGDVTAEVDGLGQRGYFRGEADWTAVSLLRSVSAWLGEEQGGVVLASARPAGAEGHDEESVTATLVERGEAIPVADPRLSTTYDGDGHQRRAGLELWMTDESGYPHRVAGEVLCGSSLDLGSLQLDVAFMHWHADGAAGVGRYDILRRR